MRKHSIPGGGEGGENTEPLRVCWCGRKEERLASGSAFILKVYFFPHFFLTELSGCTPFQGSWTGGLFRPHPSLPRRPGTQPGALNFQASPDRSLQILMSPASAAPAGPASSIFHEGTCCGWRKTPAESSQSAAVGSFNFIIPTCKQTSLRHSSWFTVFLDPRGSNAALLCRVADYVNGSLARVRPTGVTFPADR